MPDRDTAPRADFLELFMTAASGLLPAQMLEALFARLEGRK